MLALLESDSGFGFRLGEIGALGSILIIGLVVLIVVGTLFDWAPDSIYWLMQRCKRKDEAGEHPPPLPSQHRSRDDEKT
jgi:hypothetical protein